MKIFLIRKGHLMLAVGALVAMAIFFTVNVPSAVEASVATRQLPIYCVDRSDNMVAISFDAAWGNAVSLEWVKTWACSSAQIFRLAFSFQKREKRPEISRFQVFYGCGGRTRNKRPTG